MKLICKTGVTEKIVWVNLKLIVMQYMAVLRRIRADSDGWGTGARVRGGAEP